MASSCVRGTVAFILVLVAALALAGTAAGSNNVASCYGEFANQEPIHTMCKEDNENLVESGVRDSDKQLILNYHNKVRRETEPPAADLTLLYWDDQLAEVAQKLAKQCTVWHDRNRVLPGFWRNSKIGQNIAAGQWTWEKAMHAWYKEIKYLRYGEDPKFYIGRGGWRKIGHYTLLVSNRIHRIGCGFARCDNSRWYRYYVCNYAGNQISFRYPYLNGTARCSGCEDSCKDGLCDCRGKYCYNKGKLDVNTCTCKCQKNYKGADCSILECPAKDRGVCGTRWPVSYCKKYSNVPFDCPYMCGFCPQ